MVDFRTQEAVSKALAMKSARLGDHVLPIKPWSEPQAPARESKEKAGFKREFFPQRNQKEMEKEVEEVRSPV